MSQNGLKWHGAMVNDVRKSEATKQNPCFNSRRVSQFSLSHTQCHESPWPWRYPPKNGATQLAFKRGISPRSNSSENHAVFSWNGEICTRKYTVCPWHVVWTRLVVSRGTQRPFPLYLPWKSKSTIEIIGFPQVDYSFSRESGIWIIKNWGCCYLNSRLDFQGKKQHIENETPKNQRRKFLQNQSLKSSFRTRMPFSIFNWKYKLKEVIIKLHLQGFMLWWIKNNPHRTWVNWTYQGELLLRKGKKINPHCLIPWHGAMVKSFYTGRPAMLVYRRVMTEIFTNRHGETSTDWGEWTNSLIIWKQLGVDRPDSHVQTWICPKKLFPTYPVNLMATPNKNNEN